MVKNELRNGEAVLRRHSSNPVPVGKHGAPSDSPTGGAWEGDRRAFLWILRPGPVPAGRGARTLEASRPRGGAVFNLHDVEARRRQPEELGKGQAREVIAWQKSDDPLLRVERQACLQALACAFSGVEAARVVMARG